MPAGAKKPIYAPYVEHVPPDTTAAIFWHETGKGADASTAGHNSLPPSKQRESLVAR